LAAGREDTQPADDDALEQYGSARRHLGCEMRQVRIMKAHQAACARRHRDNDEVLSLDLRDPDTVRAKQIQAVSGSRVATTRDTATT
jgi:hypothetical protein